MSQIKYREIWEAARERLVARYLQAYPELDRCKAMNIISDRHEEIGAEMDKIIEAEAGWKIRKR